MKPTEKLQVKIVVLKLCLLHVKINQMFCERTSLDTEEHPELPARAKSGVGQCGGDEHISSFGTTFVHHGFDSVSDSVHAAGRDQISLS